MIAAEDGLANCVRLLLDAGADKEAQSNVSRRSLLFICAFLLGFLSLHSTFCIGTYF